MIRWCGGSVRVLVADGAGYIGEVLVTCLLQEALDTAVIDDRSTGIERASRRTARRASAGHRSEQARIGDVRDTQTRNGILLALLPNVRPVPFAEGVRRATQSALGTAGGVG